MQFSVAIMSPGSCTSKGSSKVDAAKQDDMLNSSCLFYCINNYFSKSMSVMIFNIIRSTFQS